MTQEPLRRMEQTMNKLHKSHDVCRIEDVQYCSSVYLNSQVILKFLKHLALHRSSIWPSCESRKTNGLAKPRFSMHQASCSKFGKWREMCRKMRFQSTNQRQVGKLSHLSSQMSFHTSKDHLKITSARYNHLAEFMRCGANFVGLKFEPFQIINFNLIIWIYVFEIIWIIRRFI